MPRGIPGPGIPKWKRNVGPANKAIQEKVVQSVSPKRKLMLDGLLMGRNPTQARRGAGLLPDNRNRKLMETKGVQYYLKRINQALEKENARFEKQPEYKDKYVEVRAGSRLLPMLVVKVLVEGLHATKLYGKNAVVHPDHRTRLLFVDRLAEFFKWRKQEGVGGPGQGMPTYSQFNFFSVPEGERAKFDNQFKQFLQHFYKKSKDQD